MCLIVVFYGFMHVMVVCMCDVLVCMYVCLFIVVFWGAIFECVQCMYVHLIAFALKVDLCVRPLLIIFDIYENDNSEKYFVK